MMWHIYSMDTSLHIECISRYEYLVYDGRGDRLSRPAVIVAISVPRRCTSVLISFRLHHVISPWQGRRYNTVNGGGVSPCQEEFPESIKKNISE